MRTAVEEHGREPLDEDIWDGFARRLSYVAVPFDQEDGYARLRSHLEGLDADHGTRGNRLFYLATAPEFFPVIAERLGGAGLAEEPDDGERFARLVVEKPFGMDLASARELNARLNVVFRERQVYRIDHYLGKETVQNLLVCGSATRSSSRSGTAATSTTSRSRWPRTWASGGGAATTTSPGRCATSSRTT